ncbi:Fur-regulated basic protein FbpA [Bacillus atrophaeus]|uniref:Fur-regulated basic protein FbpA n=1 Tax=Bacillus atrophaeus TaxID=1452 RepID=UPI00077AB03F|nr:Fur-regulated basic protein FbpA [Bacillus atrophaeus]ARW06413.1 Stress response protein YkoL [Bacillus atrophaeus]KXZ14193.1 stress protein [Bacillus atrophaeus]MBJ7895777.1 Fur-regulated basic protein FbpA [Bacillus atrophaeus]MCY7948701.1 Fur-regulated basic protein FbpA [Bacillus atrophaeus]MCY8097384.1 Fur-regulated basic protein FbpA [Bacillus atrophaeus]
MSNFLKTALEKERSHYSEKLYQIGVYNKEVMKEMTISELRREYAYFYRKIPYLKQSPYTK